MGRIRTMPKATLAKKAPPAVLPIPGPWRATFVRLSVCFDVTFSKRGLLELAEALRTAPNDFYWAGSTKADVEAGVSAHQVGAAAERTLHVSFEFQAKGQAPFPKVPARTLAKFVEHLRQAELIKLVHAEFAQTIDDDFPVRFPEATVMPDGKKLVVTSFNYEIIDGEESDVAVGTGMRRQASGGAITLTYWLKASRVVSDLAAGFELARQLTIGKSTGNNGGV